MRWLGTVAPHEASDGRCARCVKWLGLLTLLSSAACAGKAPVTAHAERGVRDTTLASEACARDVGADVNRDGRADLFEGKRGAQVHCRAVDFDFDGVIDQTSFFDEQGRVRRRESDLDGDGVPNVIELYEQGVLTMRMMDTRQRGAIDVWDLFDKGGERIARERDLDGNGRIDEFWRFDGEQTTIRFDVDGDGVPDEEGALRYGEPPQPAPGESAAPAASAQGAPAVEAAPGAASEAAQ